MTSKSYCAFLSYSRGDAKLAAWLHKRLDAYRTPRALVGTQGVHGSVPATLHPVFRDTDDLSSGGELSQRLVEALRSSAALIVLCTPRAATSKWVNAEVDEFVGRNGLSRVIPVLIAGEPDSDDPTIECLPTSLRRTGLLGADLRRLTASQDARHSDSVYLGTLKIIAGLLGTDLDDLRRRDEVRRRRQLATLTAASIVLAATTIAAGLFWFDSAEKGHSLSLNVRELGRVNTELEAAVREKTSALVEARSERESANAARDQARLDAARARAAESAALDQRNSALKANANLLATLGRQRLVLGDVAPAIAYALEATHVEGSIGGTRDKLLSVGYSLLRDASIADRFLFSMNGHTASITAIGELRSHALIWSASRDCTLRLWEGKTGTAVRTYDLTPFGAKNFKWILPRSMSGCISQTYYHEKSQLFIVLMEGHLVWVDPKRGAIGKASSEKEYFGELHSIGEWFFGLDRLSGNLKRIELTVDGASITTVAAQNLCSRASDDRCDSNLISTHPPIILSRPRGGKSLSECFLVNPESGTIVKRVETGRQFQQISQIEPLGDRGLLALSSDLELRSVTAECTLAYSSSEGTTSKLRLAKIVASGPHGALVLDQSGYTGVIASLSERGETKTGASISIPGGFATAAISANALMLGEDSGRVRVFDLDDGRWRTGDAAPITSYFPSLCESPSFSTKLRLGGSPCRVSALRAIGSETLAVGYADGRIDMISKTGTFDHGIIRASGQLAAAEIIGNAILTAEYHDADKCEIVYRRRLLAPGSPSMDIGSTRGLCDLERASTRAGLADFRSRLRGLFSEDGGSVVFWLDSFPEADLIGGYWFSTISHSAGIAPLAGPKDRPPFSPRCVPSPLPSEWNEGQRVCAVRSAPTRLSHGRAFVTVDDQLRPLFWSTSTGQNLAVDASSGSGILWDAIKRGDRRDIPALRFSSNRDIVSINPIVAAFDERLNMVMVARPLHGGTVAISTPDRKVQFDRLSDYQLDAPHRCVLFSPDGSHIAIGINDSLAIWNVRSGRLVTTVAIGFASRYCLSVPDSSLAIVADSGSLALIDMLKLEMIGTPLSGADWQAVVSARLQGGVLWFLTRSIRGNAFPAGLPEYRVHNLRPPLGIPLLAWARLSSRRFLIDEERTTAFMPPVASEREGSNCFTAWEWSLDPKRVVGRPALGPFFKSEDDDINVNSQALSDCLQNRRGDRTGREHFKAGIVQSLLGRGLLGPFLDEALASFRSAQKMGYSAAYLAEAALLMSKRDRSPKDLDRAEEVLLVAPRDVSAEAQGLRVAVLMERYLTEGKGSKDDMGRLLMNAACRGSFFANVMIAQEFVSRIARAHALGPDTPQKGEVWLPIPNRPAWCVVPEVREASLSRIELLAAAAFTHLVVAEGRFKEARVGATTITDWRASLARALPPQLVVNLVSRFPESGSR